MIAWMNSWWGMPITLLSGAALAIFGGWFVYWLTWEPIYHPGGCRCRRCEWELRSKERKRLRLERASNRPRRT